MLFVFRRNCPEKRLARKSNDCGAAILVHAGQEMPVQSELRLC
jgi:hypothetical protein